MNLLLSGKTQPAILQMNNRLLKKSHYNSIMKTLKKTTMRFCDYILCLFCR
jgi:hypothetical protein